MVIQRIADLDHVLSLIREDAFSHLRTRLHPARSDLPFPRSPHCFGVCSQRELVAVVKIAVIAIAIVLGFSAMVMPVLVRPPQTVEQPPGSDPAGPH